MNDVSTPIAELRRRVVAFRDARDWRQFHHPKDLALGLTVEAGELAELFLWRPDEEVDALLADTGFRRRLADELADVLIFLLYLAEEADLDVAGAVTDKLAANDAKYPVAKARGRAAKYTELDG